MVPAWVGSWGGLCLRIRWYYCFLCLAWSLARSLVRARVSPSWLLFHCSPYRFMSVSGFTLRKDVWSVAALRRWVRGGVLVVVSYSLARSGSPLCLSVFAHLFASPLARSPLGLSAIVFVMRCSFLSEVHSRYWPSARAFIYFLTRPYSLASN